VAEPGIEYIFLWE